MGGSRGEKKLLCLEAALDSVDEITEGRGMLWCRYSTESLCCIESSAMVGGLGVFFFSTRDKSIRLTLEKSGIRFKDLFVVKRKPKCRCVTKGRFLDSRARRSSSLHSLAATVTVTVTSVLFAVQESSNLLTSSQRRRIPRCSRCSACNVHRGVVAAAADAAR